MMRAWAWLCLLPLLAPADAEACSDEALAAIDFQILPADGSEAPANTLVWIALGSHGDVATDFALQQSGAAVTTTAREIQVAGEVDTTLLVLTPTTPFIAGQPVTVTRMGQPMSTFTVTANPAGTPPAEPSVTEVDVVSEYYGCFSCPESSSVSIATSNDTAILFVARDAPTQLPAQVLAVGRAGDATVFELGEGEHTLQVVSVDLAGQLGPPRAVTITVPPKVSSCSVGGAGPIAVAICAPLLLRRRRRNRR